MAQQTKRNKEVFANAMTQVMPHIWDNEADFSEEQLKKLLSTLQELKSQICEEYNPNEEVKTNSAVEVELKENNEQTIDLTSKEKLQEVLDIVTSTKCLPTHLTHDLDNYAKAKDKSGCIGAIVDESLWDGSLIGKVSKEQLIKGIIAIRNDYPELFVSFNEELPIKDNPSNWTVGYFNTQRNLLRTNFSIERLCHLVLVYEKLFCNVAEENNSAPFVTGSDDVKSNSCSQIRQMLKKKLLIIIGIVVVLLLAIGGIFLVKARNKTAVLSGNESPKDKISGQSGSTSNVEAEPAVIKTPAQSSPAQMPIGNKQKEKPSEDTKKNAMPIGNKQATKQPENKANPAAMPVGDKTSNPVAETK